MNLKSIKMKTKNVIETGFLPLNGNEIQNTRGGFGICALILIGLAGAAGAEIFGDWDNFKAGIAGEPEM